MNQPLRVVVTRSAAQAPAFARQLAARGAAPLIFPAIAIVPLPAPDLAAAVADLSRNDWAVFTSVNAVRFLCERVTPDTLRATGVRIAAVGSATAAALNRAGLAPDFLPSTFTGAALAGEIGALDGRRVLLPRARRGRPEIVAGLRDQGAQVADIPLYDTVRATPSADDWQRLAAGFDVVTFTSPSSVRNFTALVRDSAPTALADLLGEHLAHARIACIGPSTSAEATQYGYTVDVMPSAYTLTALVAAVFTLVEET